MAQINLERKQASPLRWLLPVLVLALLLWWFLSQRTDEWQPAAADTAATAPAVQPAPGTGAAGDTAAAAAAPAGTRR